MNNVAKTKVAVIGCGHWGKNLVRNMAELDALGAVVDANPEIAAKLAAAHGSIARGWNEVLVDPTIDAVVIAAPAELHHKLGLQAFDAGKHVYVEKPMALTEADAHELAAKAVASGKILMVGHLLQYHPGFIALREAVESGRVGKLRQVISNRLSLGKFRNEENVLWSFAPHDISMLLSLAGKGNAVSRVHAEGACFLQKGIEDSVTIHVDFDSGLTGRIFVCWLHPFKEQRLVVVGETGMLVFDDTQPWSSKLVLYPHQVDTSGPVPVPVKAEAQTLDVIEDQPLKAECAHFLAAIQGEYAPRTDSTEGLRVLEVLVAAQKSLDSRKG